MDNPLVSIITPNYNCEKFIAKTIESVKKQTYTNWEMLIQDDCSTDNSLTIALYYTQKDSRIKVERNTKNVGAAVTRNNAIMRSQGEYLAFLDSDDLWLPSKLEYQLRFMQENNCDFSFTKYEHIDEDGKSLGIEANVIRKLTYTKMLMHNWAGCLTVIYRQDLERKVYGGDVPKDNDRALFLKVLKQCRNAQGINECLALYRIRKGSISRNKFKMIKPLITVVHDMEGHNLLVTYFCLFTQIFIKTFYKYKKTKNNINIQNQ